MCVHTSGHHCTRQVNEMCPYTAVLRHLAVVCAKAVTGESLVTCAHKRGAAKWVPRPLQLVQVWSLGPGSWTVTSQGITRNAYKMTMYQLFVTESTCQLASLEHYRTQWELAVLSAIKSSHSSAKTHILHCRTCTTVISNYCIVTVI